MRSGSRLASASSIPGCARPRRGASRDVPCSAVHRAARSCAARAGLVRTLDRRVAGACRAAAIARASAAPAELSRTIGSAPPRSRPISCATLMPSISGMSMSSTATSNGAPARSSSSASVPEGSGQTSMPQALSWRDRIQRLAWLSSTTRARFACSAAAISSSVAAGSSARGARIVKWNVEPAPTSLSTHRRPPIRSTSRIEIARPRAGAAVAARGRGVELRERLEQPVDEMRGDADAGVAHGEVQLVRAFGGRERGRRDVEDHLAGLGELERVADQVHQHLAQARDVADQGFRHVVLAGVRELHPLARDLWPEQVERLLDAGAQVERLVLELHVPGLDLREVEDVVDDGEQGVAAGADRVDQLALLLVER